MTVALQMVKIVATALSFWGLCELVRDWLGAGIAFAPSVAASLVMLALVVAGIAKALPYAWWALFAGGLAWWLASLVRGRLRVRWAAVALGLLTVFACLHFKDAYYTGSDSVSHWGLVARHLLENDRFPDATSRLVFFKSYPLGATSFIYYLCRGLNAREGQYLAAMFMLYPIYLLPTCGMIRRNRLLGAMVGGALLATAAFVLGTTTSLQVDILLGCMAMGGIATAACCQDDPRRAMRLVLPTATALVVVKSSGIVLALLLLLAVAWTARRSGMAWRGKGGASRLLLAGLLAVLAMFLLWQGHVRLTFGAENMGKHGLSLGGFASMVSSKSAAQVLTVAKRMAKWLVWPYAEQRRFRAVCLGLYALCLVAIRLWHPNRKYWLSALRRTFVASTALYLIWHGLLFLMYLFSMPVAEAVELASIGRYESTMSVVTAGLLATFIMACFCGEDFKIGTGAYAGALAALVALGCLPVAGTSWGRSLARKAVVPARVTQQPFKGFLEARRRGEIEEDKSYLVFVKQAERSMTQAYYLVKYEMRTLDIGVLATQIDVPWLDREYDLDAYYLLDGITGNQGANVVQIDDLPSFFDETLGQYDYLLLFSGDSGLEDLLEAYEASHDADIRVLRCY